LEVVLAKKCFVEEIFGSSLAKGKFPSPLLAEMLV